MRTLMKQHLIETLDKFEKIILVKPRPIGLRIISKDKIIKDASQNFIYKKMIEKGIFKDFANEYPVFMVVYSYDKNPYNIPLTGRCWIGYCEEIANIQVSKLTDSEIKTYLIYTIAHELTHIMEDIIEEKRPDLFSNAWHSTPNVMNRRELASEALAEDVAYMLSDKEEVNKIVNKIWGNIFKRAAELT